LETLDQEAKKRPRDSKKILILNDNNQTVLLTAKLGTSAIYRDIDFDDPTDPGVLDVTGSSKTIALVSCRSNQKRLVRYARASLP